MVLRKTEYVKRSAEAGGPYVVVVIRSWRRAQDRLQSFSYIWSDNRFMEVYNDAYIPPTQMIN